MQRSLFTDLFFDFLFWFSFWFWLYLDRTRGIVDGFCKCAALAFLRTIYVCKIIAYHTTIWITAAASGNACKSVWNPFASKKNKGQKKSVSKTPCASVRSVSFFWPSFCSRRLTGRIMAWLIYIHILNIYRKITLLHGALWACGYRAWIKKHSRIITDATESFHGFVFWFLFRFSFWFRFWFSFDFDCTLTGQGGFKTDFVWG